MTALHDPDQRGFASDNYSGVCPEVLAAIAEANGGHQSAYGADRYTERLAEVVRANFGEQAEAYPVFNGTGANVVGLSSVVPRWGAVICASTAHINVDECGAPERVGGFKLLPVPAPGGKLTPELIDVEAWGFDDVHRARPSAVSITQSTELGTLYSVEEIRAIAEHVHGLGMALHLDGARLGNAAAALGVSLRELTVDAGVDVLSLGATKNGALFGEAVVVLNPERAQGVDYIRKAQMQLASKMRFVSAQLIALYEGDVWRRNAEHANAMARRLAAALDGVEGVTLSNRVEANAVFAILDPAVADRVRARFPFYDWDAARHEVRWMAGFDTSEEDVDGFADLVREELEAARRA
ncbi:threonine aldolase family protein [Arthrobacter sp. UM1]|uniref:threonine aldolase family protein n=1 Tax=Arthrobacter sp. UM1 TaxID=2766776 RepID=UPI001CF6A3E0|nr:beta-eliminating lyase-related protein [Arthrobacter sp. UM1]MCB4207642.1 threonine aldolase [Arthrobacter sp. UM1]